MTHHIDIARDFSPFPYGRTEEHGPFNGQRFQNELLLPALASGEPVVVNLDGTTGMAPSFIDEAFGTLTERGFDYQQLRRQLSFVAQDQSLTGEIWHYIEIRAVTDAAA